MPKRKRFLAVQIFWFQYLQSTAEQSEKHVNLLEVDLKDEEIWYDQQEDTAKTKDKDKDIGSDWVI